MLRLILQNLRNSVNAARTAAASNVSVTVPTTQNVQRRSIAVSSAVNLKQSKTISVSYTVLLLVFLVTFFFFFFKLIIRLLTVSVSV